MIKKTIYLVNRDFQFRYAYAAVVAGLLTTALSVAIVLTPLYIFGILRIPKFLPTPILMAMGFAVIINILVVGFMAILMTHKIAGPIYSLIRAMRHVELGRWANGSLKVRKGDDLRYVVRNFNSMVESLVVTGKEDLEVVKNAINASSLEQVQKDLQQLKERLEYRTSEGSIIGEILSE